MARKKTSRKSGARRSTRRRISGMGAASGTLMEVAGVLGGMVVANMVSGKLFPNMDGKIKGAVLVGGGILLKNYMGKNPMLSNVATGLAVGGGVQLLQGLGVISGIGAGAPVLLLPSQQGVPQMIAGSGISQVVAGSYRPGMAGGGGIDAATAAVI